MKTKVNVTIEYNPKSKFVTVTDTEKPLLYLGSQFKDITPTIRIDLRKLFCKKLSFGNIDYFTEKVLKKKQVKK